MHRTIRYALLVAAGVLLLAALSSSAEEHAYVGVKNCKKCHLKQWKSWAETKMAQTFEQLKPGVGAEAKTAAGLEADKDYTTDPECLRCHTTGYGKPGGFVDLAASEDLVGVGCEMCHGAGGTYIQKEYMSLQNKEYKLADVVAAGMTGEITVTQCQNCHNTDSPFVGDDYVFDFEARKSEGTHENFPLKYEH